MIPREVVLWSDLNTAVAIVLIIFALLLNS